MKDPVPPAGERPAHSPLGASSAERWMNCPGSVALIRELALPETDEPDYRAEGTAMHEAAEKCLRGGLDTWETVGEKFGGVEITPQMADAIQIYLDVCRREIDTAAYYYVEFGVSSPIHPLFYGTLDFAAIHGKAKEKGEFIVPELVVVTDLKGGEGIIVEPEDNPQLKYYAFGLIDKNPHWPDETPVLVRIIQPRAFHTDGPIREWETTVGEIREWVHDTLVPAMARAEYDNTLDAGPWCRFCPAKLVCPMLTSLYRAAMTYNPQHIVNMDDAAIGRSYQFAQAVKFYLKALEEETFRRLNNGVQMGGFAKMVKKKSNRVFKAEAPALAKIKFGADALTAPELKSPAELEKLGPEAKDFVKEYSYQPDTGFTVAGWDDPRHAVTIKTVTETFGAAVKNLVDSGEVPS